MVNKIDLIQQAVGFQKEINQLIMRYRPERWMVLDLTIAQLKSIVYIYSKGSVNFKELAMALNVSPSVVTGIVDRLTSQDIINRLPSKGDRRVQWLLITDKGRALIDDIKQETIREIAQILETLSDEDLSALVQGFSAFIGAAEPYLENRTKSIDVM